MNTRLSLLFLFALSALSAGATSRHLLPRPQQMHAVEGGSSFALGRPVALEDATHCAYLRRVLEETGCQIDGTATARVTVKLVENVDGSHDYALDGFENEAYTLRIGADLVEIQAITPTGVIRAAQTLQQLAEDDNQGWVASLEPVEIVDWPAFKVRGIMHDVGRSYLAVDRIKRNIDLLARFKINLFHWHLSENQAWRFEVKAYPQLTSASSMTRYAGSYYTQEECREVQEYCYERGITILPELDMPGHSEAFTRAMGFSMQTAQGVAVLKAALTELASVFDRSPYIHIGADEQAITYQNFIPTITSHIHSLGKKVCVWNPISGVDIDPATLGVDITQMWSTAGKKVAGIPNINSKYYYANLHDTFADVVGLFKSNIYYEPQGTEEVSGFVVCLWNDRKLPTEEDIIKQNNLYAMTLACGERAWKGGGEQYIEDGGTVLPNEGKEYEEFCDWEARFLWHKAHSLKDEPIPYVRQADVRWRLTEAFMNGGDAKKSFPPEEIFLGDGQDDMRSGREQVPLTFQYGGQTYGSKPITGAGQYLRHTWGAVISTHMPYYMDGMTCYAWTYVYSETAQTVGAQIEFFNYGRSEVDPLPYEGCWDRKGSRIWLNGTEIEPPVWENQGNTITKELDLRNENFTAREPIPVQLEAGWNCVLVKLPYAADAGTRLNKWEWTFVLTDLEGKNAADGLVYSPTCSLDGENWEDTTDSSDAAPALSQEGEEQYYTFGALLRCARYVTASSDNSYLTGAENLAPEACWALLDRGDGTFNIKNYATGAYISPSASYNTRLTTTSTPPAQGWMLKEAATKGFYIIVSGTSQINQTNSGLSYAIYNWGSGTDVSDEGCQFRFSPVDVAQFPREIDTAPEFSSVDAPKFYFFAATQRCNRYVASTGADQNVTSQTSASDEAAWAFIDRGDGTCDIWNFADQSYLSPAATKNTSLYTTSAVPSAGWKISPASTAGFFILTSGTSQVNQTNSGLGYAIYNWGDGTNKTDTGCQFRFYEAAALNEVTALADQLTLPADRGEVYGIDGRRLPTRAPLPHGFYIVDGRKRVF